MKEFIDKLIGRLEANAFPLTYNFETEKYLKYDKAIEIVNELAEEYKNDCCEWKQDGVYLICQNHENNLACVEDEGYRYNYCPICGKKIKVVDNLPAWKTAVMNTFLARK